MCCFITPTLSVWSSGFQKGPWHIGKMIPVPYIFKFEKLNGREWWLYLNFSPYLEFSLLGVQECNFSKQGENSIENMLVKYLPKPLTRLIRGPYITI